MAGSARSHFRTTSPASLLSFRGRCPAGGQTGGGRAVPALTSERLLPFPAFPSVADARRAGRRAAGGRCPLPPPNGCFRSSRFLPWPTSGGRAGGARSHFRTAASASRVSFRGRPAGGLCPHPLPNNLSRFPRSLPWPSRAFPHVADALKSHSAFSPGTILRIIPKRRNARAACTARACQKTGAHRRCLWAPAAFPLFPFALTRSPRRRAGPARWPRWRWACPRGRSCPPGGPPARPR